ncbi:MAG: hypothetical protein C4521_01360 [Actinobacteria bacterium]|nr:MAG: hypothetical protein C4521_01360 [Actinomycetota bacterium]
MLAEEKTEDAFLGDAGASYLLRTDRGSIVFDVALGPSSRTLSENGPRLLEAGVATTGRLARSLFMFGLTEQQALVANVKDKGLVLLTGCGIRRSR